MTYLPPTPEGWTSQEFGTNPGGYNPAGGHTGEDIAIPVGTPLVAMAEGVVVHVGYFQGKYTDNPWWIEPSFAGYVVTVDYGDYLSHYAHCSGSPVLSGRRVQPGEVVAYSGNTGSATSGPHCHWEVMPNGWDFNNGTYGRIDPRTITNATIAAQGDIETQEDELSDAQVERIINETRTMLDQFHTATRNNIIEELAKKIEDSGYDVKVFTQAVDNANTDRAILDNRATDGGK